MTTKSILLSSGRKLAYREYGDIGGQVIIFAHGNLNSSQFMPVWEKTQTESKGSHIIAVDRPGYGDSSFSENRTYIQWAADIDEFTNNLGLTKFCVAGYSSGGPHALSCGLGASIIGKSLFDKVLAICVISGDGPYLEQGAVKRMYGMETGFSLEESIERTKKIYHHMHESYCGIKSEAKKEIALNDISHAIKNGFQGAAQDAILESRSWGFGASDLVKPIRLWHGNHDSDVPAEISAMYIYNKLNPNRCHSLRIVDGENHTMIRRHWRTILEDLRTHFGDTSKI